MERTAIVVEDDTNTALALTTAISALGFSVRTANSLKEAQGLYKDESPDIVLLDVALPDGDGLELMGESTGMDNTRFVVITGDSRQEVAVRSLRARAADFLVKPVTLADLRRAVEKSLTAANDNQATTSDHVARNKRRAGSVLTTGESVGASNQSIPVEGGGLSRVIDQDDRDLVARSAHAMVGKTFWQVEKALLQATLKSHKGDKKTAAKTLGISLKTLYNRMNAYDIDL